MKFFLNTNNIMVDLETLSLESNALIVSIGAVRFFTKTTDTFYRTINLSEERLGTSDINLDTVVWWMGQSDEARAMFLDKDSVPLWRALTDFSTWIGQDATLWGNGAAFDNVVLTSAYKGENIPVPWNYSNNACFRTLKSMFPDIQTSWEGVAHNALDDAIWQAKTLIKIFKHMANN